MAVVTDVQTNLDLGGRPTAGVVLDCIRSESRDESEKGRWFEQLFMHIALQEPEFELDEIWRWPDWRAGWQHLGCLGREMSANECFC